VKKGVAYKLIVDVIPPGGGRVHVQHVFYGKTEQECNEVFTEHAAGCEFLTPALEEGRVNSEIEKISDSDWPEWDLDDADDDPDDD
jgi:hypothetical protein